MRMTKRVLAALCALTCCIGITACGKTGDNDSKVSTNAMDKEDQEAVGQIAEQLEDIDLANKKIRFLSHWDINPGEGQTAGPDLQMFKDKYGGEIEWVQTTWDNRYTDLAKMVMADDSPDFFSAMDMDGFPKGAIKAMFEPIDDYIDFDSDLWAPAKATNDAFMFNGGHYVAGIQSYPNFVCVYNKKTMEDNGFDDPAELYWKGEWTYSKFKDMCVKFTDADNDLYALDGWWFESALNDICGVPLIGLENGQVVNHMDDPQVTKIQDLLYDLQKNKVFFDRSQNNWSTRGDGSTGLGLGTHETLFIPVGLWGIEDIPANVKNFGDVEAGEIMFVPMPRMDDSDTHYVTARVDGYFLCKNAKNPEGFAAYMNCRMATKNDATEIDIKKHKEDFKWNDDMIKMRDEVVKLVNENPVYDFQDGVSPELSAEMQVVKQSSLGTNNNPTTWTQTVQEHKKAVDYLLKEANDNIASEPTAE